MRRCCPRSSESFLHEIDDGRRLAAGLGEVACCSGVAAGGEEARRVFGAMMEMKKLDVAAIEAARLG